MFVKFGTDASKGISFTAQNEFNRGNSFYSYGRTSKNGDAGDFTYDGLYWNNTLAAGLIFDFGVLGIESYYKRDTYGYRYNDYSDSEGINVFEFLLALQF